MCWFDGAPSAEDNQAPANAGDIAVITPGPNAIANSSGYIIWEGQDFTGLFNNHLTFEVRIQGNAAAQPVSTIVGTGYHAPPFAAPPPGQPPYQYNVFNIYRDNDRVVYTDPVLGAVSTIYYCTYVSIQFCLVCDGEYAKLTCISQAGTSVAAPPPFLPVP